jgi:hypothetical protein
MIMIYYNLMQQWCTKSHNVVNFNCIGKNIFCAKPKLQLIGNLLLIHQKLLFSCVQVGMSYPLKRPGLLTSMVAIQTTFA